jgi:hypothetical protein
MADMMLNDPDPEVRRAYLAAYHENAPDLPRRKRAPMPKILYRCGTDNDGFPTCQGDRTTCGLGGVCAELDPDPPAVAPLATVPPPDGFLMGADQPEDEDDEDEFFTARYDGKCSACDEYHISGGYTMIRSDGMDGWEAQECAW